MKLGIVLIVSVFSLAFCCITGDLFADSCNTSHLSELTQSEGESCSVEIQALKPEAEKVRKLKEYFEPLQNTPQYYGDRRFRRKLRSFEVKKIKAYKPNFGKKIWVKSWKLRDIKKKIRLFGRKIAKRKFYITAIEVAEDVAPYLKRELAGTHVDYETWSQRIEEFGRTYVNPSRAGKKKCRIVVADYQNGNYLMVQATKPFRKKMAYFIGEDYNVIIEKLLAYKTRAQRKKTTGGE